MKNVTASKLGLLYQCRYWARDEVPHRSSSSAAASRGTAFHLAMERLVKTGSPGPVGEDLELAQLVTAGASWFMINAKSRVPVAEIAYAWDPATDRGYFLQPAIERYCADHGLPRERAYANAEAWPEIARMAGCPTSVITMTIDLLESTGEAWTVSDWCTGSTDKYHQLAINALAVARAHGLAKVHTQALHVTIEGVTVQPYSFDATALDYLAARIRGLVAEVHESSPEPGAHCTGLYCPAVNACPAAQALIPASTLTVRRPFSAEIADMDHAAALVSQVALAKAFVAQVDDALKSWARANDGVPLPDGKVWRETFRTMTRTNAAKMRALAVELGASPERLSTCDSETRESAGFRAVKR
jgi:hypothetical protein